ncbi:ribonuclease HII [Candidatus Acetothermia bacterium]|nr:ribonuclease HII [Candidatus Acetothermia bacterium]MBI3644190.1 ribonuclease HII [Candidatus Acetothermia bacterium]
MTLILGIDEAGRGPVIGPMVVAGALFDSSTLKALREIGVKDSKQLSRGQREELFAQIETIAHSVHVLLFHPHELEENLTQIELRAMSEVIQKSRPATAVLDAPVPPGGIPAFANRLHKMTGMTNLKMIAENRADANYEVVSAASIVAKVHRDRAVEELWKEYGDFGWGYPAEPRTREFLKKWYVTHRRFPDCVRHRWATVQKIIYECNAGVLPL